MQVIPYRAALRVAVAFAATTTLACAPGHHTVEPYRSDPDAASTLEARAGAFCVEKRGADAPPPEHAFVTDGCSAWPDGDRYVACCVEHDILYWCGGSAEDRRAADDDFGRCVSENASPSLGWWMRAGVRMGGHPVLPFHWRWGYGDAYRGGYPAEDPDADSP